MQDKNITHQAKLDNEQYPYNIYSQQKGLLNERVEEGIRQINRKERRQRKQRFPKQHQNGGNFQKQGYQKGYRHHDRNNIGERREGKRRPQQSDYRRQIQNDQDRKEGEIPENRKNYHGEKRQRKQRNPYEAQRKLLKDVQMEIDLQLKINQLSQDKIHKEKPNIIVQLDQKNQIQASQKQIERKFEKMNINQFQDNRRHNQRRQRGFQNRQKGEKHEHYHRGNHHHHQHFESHKHHKKHQRKHFPRQQIIEGQINQQGQILPRQAQYQDRRHRQRRNDKFGQEDNIKFEKKQRRQRWNQNRRQDNRINPEVMIKIQNEKNQPMQVRSSNKNQLSEVKINQQKTGQQQQIPEALLCPISQILMNDPIMITVCGHSFENQMISSWLKKEKSCPLCKKACTEANLQKNYALLSLVGNYK